MISSKVSLLYPRVPALSARLTGVFFALAGFVFLTPGGALAQSVDTASKPGITGTAGSPASFVPPMSPAADQEVLLDDIQGTVSFKKKGETEWAPAEKGTKLKEGDSVKTGPFSSAEIGFDGKATLYLTENSEIIVSEARRAGRNIRITEVSVPSGRLKAKIDRLQGASSFKLKTPTAVAAVRGTVLYLNVALMGRAVAQHLTDLYVDTGSVGFSPLNNLSAETLIGRFGLGGILGDGTVLPSRTLTSSERREFIAVFEEAYRRAGNPQTEVEEGAAAEDTAGDEGEGEDSDNDHKSDQLTSSASAQEFYRRLALQAALNRARITALLIKTSLQFLFADNIFENQGSDVDTAGLLAGGPERSGGWNFDTLVRHFDQGIVDAARLDSLSAAERALDSSETAVDGLMESVDGIFERLRGALGTQQNASFVSSAEALSRQADLFYGSVEDNSVEIRNRRAELDALRARERNELRNVLDRILEDEAFRRGQAQIEKAFDAQTGKVFTDAHGYRVRTDQYIFQPDERSVEVISLSLRRAGPQAGITALIWGAGFSDDIRVPLRELPWNQYLNVVTDDEIKEKDIRLPGSIRESGQFVVHESDPGNFYPESFYARFVNPGGDEVLFSERYSRPHETAYEDMRLWIQGQKREEITVTPKGGEAINAGGRRTRDEWGYQTGPIQSEDIDDFSRFDENYHPAFIAKTFRGPRNEEGGRRERYLLAGIFLPLDNAGNILDAPGFALEGLRDLISPNPLVNGGRYNLEVILKFGTLRHGNFEERFTIDALLTPELFGSYGMVNTSRLFPPRLHSDDDPD